MSSRAPDESPIPLGTVLRDTYELVSVLGSGAMGTVFLARHLRLPGKQVAIKVLHAHEEMTATQYARFRREAQISSRLHHPNIVSVLDFNDRENGTPFLVMEHLKGESLARRLRRGRPPLAETLSITRQIGAALHAAHQVGVIHRDLKPGNIYLLPPESDADGGPRVKLLDFGISKIVSSRSIQTRDDVLLGTPRYMSPEQAMGQNSTVDGRSDLFSLACIVYELLCGEPPFVGASVADILYRIVYDPPPPVSARCPEASGTMIAALERALAKKPEARYPDVAAFVSELTGTPLVLAAPITSGPASAGPATPSAATLPLTVIETPAVAPPKRRMGKTVAAVVIGAVTTAGAILLWPDPTPKTAVQENGASSQAAAQTPGPTTPVTQPGAPATPSQAATPESVPDAQASAPMPSQAIPPKEGSDTQAVASTSPLGADKPERVPPPTPPSADALSAQSPPELAKTGAPAVSGAATTRRTPARAAAETIPEAVRTQLEEARRALEANNVAEAIRLIGRSQRTQVTGASFALLTQAHCQAKDLSNARAQWFRVPASERSQVKQYCKRYGVEF